MLCLLRKPPAEFCRNKSTENEMPLTPHFHHTYTTLPPHFLYFSESLDHYFCKANSYTSEPTSQNLLTNYNRKPNAVIYYNILILLVPFNKPSLNNI